jgi:aspartate 1-decarboxylase
MNSVKIVGSTKATNATSVAVNEHRQKLLINGPATGALGTYTLNGGAALTVAAGTTVVLAGYTGVATSANSAQLVELE